MELPEIRAEERTPLVEALLGIIRQLLDRVQQLEQTVQQLRDEIARLKGQKPRPEIKPSQLETPRPKPGESQDGKRPGSAKRPKTAELHIDREMPLHLDNPPEGATLLGFEPYVVQELIIKTETTKYQRARYALPEGGSLLAPFPPGVLPVEGGHFGANLITYILDQYHQAQVTEPLLLEQLWEFGIDISAGQLHRILTENKAVVHQEKAELLAAGLAESSYIGTDDTGARHRGKNGYCTAIGNDLFAYFESTDSKSRLNFLHVLQGDQRHYALNETARAYWQRQELATALLEQLTQGPQEFADAQAWQARLAELAITNERHVRIATEGALLGGLSARGVSPDLVVLSDGAPQFVVLVHAACWIHAERPLAKLVPHHEEHRAAIENIRQQIWELYKDLKNYRIQPDEAQRPVFEARFDALVEQRTGYPSIDGVLKEMRDHKADLLRVLERPEVPLHNNAMESDIREFVKRRKISGGTRNEAGRRCRDTFASLKKTCRKLGVCFWHYLQDRVRGLRQIARLAELIRQKARTTPTEQAVPL
ncbi:MAG: transposase [Gammaproteobacteria bacterium]|nr:transposase [Gammaproteobacteria bacterium]